MPYLQYSRKVRCSNMKNVGKSFQIILVTSWFPPTKLISGVGESSFGLAQALVDRGHQVTVICSDADQDKRLLPSDFNQVERPGLRILAYRYIFSKWMGFTIDIPSLLSQCY